MLGLSQTPLRNHGADAEAMLKTTKIDTSVRSVLAGDEKRFSRNHFTAPVSVAGGGASGSMCLRTKDIWSCGMAQRSFSLMELL